MFKQAFLYLGLAKVWARKKGLCRKYQLHWDRYLQVSLIFFANHHERDLGFF